MVCQEKDMVLILTSKLGVNELCFFFLCFVYLSQVADRHDLLLKLQGNVKDLEEQNREAMATINHRGEVIKQLREEIKTLERKVGRESELNRKMKNIIQYSHSNRDIPSAAKQFCPY